MDYNKIYRSLKKLFNLLWLCVVILWYTSYFVNAQIVSKAAEDLFVLGDESITFISKINGHHYKLYIHLPDNYTTSGVKTYPVYYALDGHGTFGLTTAIYNGMRYDAFVPELIIVGITYGGEKPDIGYLRGTDLTPTKVENTRSSGGASKFLKVLSDEIIPLIERFYRTDKTNRTLAGTSYGGLFTHYALLTQPSLFNGYLINCPSYWWDNDYAFNLEQKYSEHHTNLNARVMIVSGEYDDVVKATRMVNQFKERQYQNFELKYRSVDQMGHLGGEAEAIIHAMKFIYQKPIMKLPKHDLLPYTGTYKLKDTEGVIVIKDGDLSWVDTHYPNGVKIVANSKSTFSFMNNYLDFNFIKDDNGIVTGFYIQLSHWENATAQKIK